jgi:hypothetical protein
MLLVRGRRLNRRSADACFEAKAEACAASLKAERWRGVARSEGRGPSFGLACVRPLLVAFASGEVGSWAVERLETVAGAPLELASRLEVIEGKASPLDGRSAWVLRGVSSNERYVSRIEHAALVSKQEPLGRAASTRAALIPITKSDAWWELAQDERRRIFEESSHHVATGLEYLPAVARRLHHGRDLGEPFDFLTWFEYAPEHKDAFESSSTAYVRPKSGPTSNARSTSGYSVSRGRSPVATLESRASYRSCHRRTPPRGSDRLHPAGAELSAHLSVVVVDTSRGSVRESRPSSAANPAMRGSGRTRAGASVRAVRAAALLEAVADVDDGVDGG